MLIGELAAATQPIIRAKTNSRRMSLSSVETRRRKSIPVSKHSSDERRGLRSVMSLGARIRRDSESGHNISGYRVFINVFGVSGSVVFGRTIFITIVISNAISVRIIDEIWPHFHSASA